MVVSFASSHHFPVVHTIPLLPVVSYCISAFVFRIRVKLVLERSHSPFFTAIFWIFVSSGVRASIDVLFPFVSVIVTSEPEPFRLTISPVAFPVGVELVASQ